MSSTEGDPKPPVKYAHAAPEGEELEQWKTSVLVMIDKRIDLYPLPPSNALPARMSRAVLSLLARMKRFLTSLLRLFRSKAASIYWNKTLEQDQPAIILDPDRLVSAVEKVGHIPELVENIIRFADAQTQIHVARKVSSLWRHTVAHVIATSTSFCQSHTRQAVELGTPQEQDATTGLPEPSDEDFQRFEHEMSLLRGLEGYEHNTPDRGWQGICPPYWPAYVRTSRALPRRIKDSLNGLRARQALSPIWANTTNEWQDFSQFNMNPYFQTLFSQELSQSRGAYELRLQSLRSSDHLVFGNFAQLRELLGLVGHLQLTKPPCKAMRLRVKRYGQHPEVLARGVPKHRLHYYQETHSYEHILNEEGITCAQVFEALEKWSEPVIDHWRRSATTFRENIVELHQYEDGVWEPHGRPTFIITLSNSNPCERIGDGPQMYMPSLIDRQLEWIPKDFVRVREYVEIRDGRVCRYPADLERELTSS